MGRKPGRIPVNWAGRARSQTAYILQVLQPRSALHLNRASAQAYWLLEAWHALSSTIHLHAAPFLLHAGILNAEKLWSPCLRRGVIEWRSLVPKVSRYFIVSTERSTEQRIVSESIRWYNLPQLFSNYKVPWCKDPSRFMRASV